MADEKEPFVFNEGEIVEAEDEIVSNVADQEISIEQAIEEATKEQSKFLKAKDIEETGMTVIQIEEVGRAYKRNFGDKVSTRVDLIVKALNGKTKGTTYTLSIGVYNLKKLTELFGKDYKTWVGKRVVISKETRGNYDFVAISNEYKPIEE